MILHNRNHREDITSRLVYADRYWNPSTSPANTNDTSSWSATDGGATGESIPTSSDNVYFTSTNSNNAVVDATFYMLDLDFSGGTGYAGTFSGSRALYAYGNVILDSAMTNTFTGIIRMNSTGTATLTTAGVVLAGNLYFEGNNGTYQLQDNVSMWGKGFYHMRGTLDTNEKTITCGAVEINLLTVALDISNSTINCTKWSNDGTYVATVTGSIIKLTGVFFTGGGKTYNEVQLNSTTHTIAGSNTFATLTRTGIATKTDSLTVTAGTTQTVTGTFTLNGNSAINRVLMKSSTLGTGYTINAATVSVNGADIQDCTGAGAGDWDISGAANYTGDCGGNTDITFTAPATTNWESGTTWSTATWSSRVPLPQDTATFTTAGTVTITQDMPRIGSVDFTGSADKTWTTSTNCSVFGSIDLTDLATLTASFQTYTFEGRSGGSIKSAGKTWAKGPTIDATGATYKITDDFTSSALRTLSVNNGTFTAVDGATNSVISIGKILINTGATITLGSATHLLTGTAGVWSCAGIVTAFTGTLKITDTSNSAITFAGGNKTYNNIWFDRGASTAINTITGTNTFAEFKDTGTEAHTITFPNVTTTVSSFVVDGSVGKLITLQRTGASGTWTLSDTTGTNAVTYCNISNSTAQGGARWIAGKGCVDGGGNTGWDFGRRRREFLGFF